MRSTGIVMVVLVALLGAAAIAEEAGASWSASTVPGGQARSGSQVMTPGHTPTAVAVPANGDDVEVSWAPTTGGPLTGYEVLARDAATDEPRAVGGTCAGLVTETICTDSDAPDGRWTYTIVSRSGAWAGTPSQPSATVLVDVVAPTVTIDFPTPGAAYDAAGWDAGCAEPGFCGTAQDVGGLSAGGVSVQQVSTGLHWDGTAFASPFRVLLDITGGTAGYHLWGFSVDDFPADGQYTVQAIAVDGAGSTTTASATFSIDREGPATPVGFPVSGGTYGTELWDAGCSQPGFCAGGETPTDVVDGGLSMLQVDTGRYWDGAAFTSTTEVLLPLPTTDVWPFPITNFPDDGAYRIRAVLTDGAGNDTVTVVPFTIDRIAPDLTPTFPLPGGVYDTAAWDAGCTPSGICGTATDDSGPVASAFVTLQEVATGLFWDGTAFAGTADHPMPFQPGGIVPFPASSFTADGEYRARVVARDVAGNLAALTGTFSIDRLDPVVDIVHPLDGGAYRADTWNAGCAAPGICGVTSDGTNDLASVRISIRRNATGAYWNGSAFTETAETFTSMDSDAYAFDAASFPADGGYTVRMEAADFGGHTAADAATFTIDRTAPAVALTFPSPGVTYNAASWAGGCPVPGICGSATDASSTVSSHAVSIRQGTGNYWNGTAFASPTEVLVSVLGTGELPLPFTSFDVDGAYTVRAVGTDAVGNTTTTSATFATDRLRPAVAGLTVTNGDGLLRVGDAVAVVFSEPLDLSTICSTWTGTGDRSLTNVSVAFTNNGIDDLISSVTSPTCALQTGTLGTRNDYAHSNAIYGSSTVSWTEATRTLRIELGVKSSGAISDAPQPLDTSTFTPSALLADRAGNAVATTPFVKANVRF